MKKVSLISIIFLIYGIAFCCNVFSQSTFNTETLTNAIIGYVQTHSHIDNAKVEIKQTISPKKFSQKDVIANISHKGDLMGNSSVDLIFSYNNEVLTKLPVKINVTSPKNNVFNNVTINKGDKVRMLYYSGTICIKMDGVATESGSTGDIIKVKKDNNQTLYGFIAEDGNVIIENKNNLVSK